jgi:glycerate 2-kinase
VRILVAPCAYKGTIGCSALAKAIARGIAMELPDAQLDLLPVADGGDGTIDALHQAVGGELRQVTVEGPLGAMVSAPWLRLGKLAIVELASASGLALLQGKVSPVDAHTKGTGQVIASCLLYGVGSIIICVGGSASTEGGAGMLTGMGARFRKADGGLIRLGASELSLVTECDLGAMYNLISGHTFVVAVDVANPLLGVDGAAAIYGPQKGAPQSMIDLLDQGLENFADVLEAETGRRMRNTPGAGAAGGTAFGAACGLGAEIVSGFDWMASLIDLEARIQAADLVVTGEGRLDEQSLFGKAIGQLATLCKKHRKKLYALPASAATNYNWARVGIDRVVRVAQPGKMARVEDVVEAARALVRY